MAQGGEIVALVGEIVAVVVSLVPIYRHLVLLALIEASWLMAAHKFEAVFWVVVDVCVLVLW